MMKIVISHSGNDGRARYERSFNTNFRMSGSKWQQFWLPLDKSSEYYLNEVGPVGKRIVEALDKVDGIVEISLKPFEAAITIGKAFAWADIGPQVIAAIKEVSAPSENLTVEGLELLK
jgi:hypothetical protein